MNVPDPKTVRDAVGLYRELHALILIESFHRRDLSFAAFTACALNGRNRETADSAGWNVKIGTERFNEASS